jgi:hypothetical protein
MTAPSYRRRSDVAWRRSLDAVLFLPPGASEPMTLAGTGPEVWDLLRDPRSLGELASELANRHGTDPEVVARDVLPVLENLAALGAVETVF